MPDTLCILFAEDVGLSPLTMEAHRQNICNKLLRFPPKPNVSGL